jgi:hypothetical protein
MDWHQVLEAAGAVALVALGIEFFTYTKDWFAARSERKASVEAAHEREMENVLNMLRARIDELEHSPTALAPPAKEAE